MLVDGFNPSDKYEFVSWDHYSQENSMVPVTTNQIYTYKIPIKSH